VNISNPHSFYQEARFQKVCQLCGSAGAFHAHHVVSKQRLKKDGLLHRVYDPRNALRLCEGLDTKHCHMEHERCNLVIPTEKLLDQNVCFIWEVLGVAGQNLLERDYTGIDRRYTLHVEGRCVCQS
jgi:hypothetical protein